jgi:4-hydroxy-4-methyl-2-oxoglutarate aldolase
MKKVLAITLITFALVALAAFKRPEPSAADDLLQGFRIVEVASVADAMEQLYGTKGYMYHDMRPLAATKFVGPAVTVMLKKEEHHDGAKAEQGMLDAIDEAPAGSVYVMVLEDGLDYAGIGGLMSTAMKARGLAGAVIDASVRDTPQIAKIQFPVFSRGVAPSSTVNHYRFAGANVAVKCAGVEVRAGDIISADMDGVVVVPIEKAHDILKRAQQLDDTEHSMLPYIEKYRSLREAVAKFGRI